jgi:hypothetical protein
MIFCAILLTVFQLSSITDPVDFYLRMVGDIDSPAFKYSEYADDNRMSLYFRVSPESEILVKQNDKTIGIIHNELRLDVRSGTVTLDGTSAGQPVIVEIVLAEREKF